MEKMGHEPGRGQIGIRRVKIARRLRPPWAGAAAVVAAAARAARRPHAASLPVQRSAPQLQLLPIHLLLLVAEQLVDEHAGEYTGKDPGHRNAEQSSEAGVEGAVNRLAVRRPLEQNSWISFRRPVTRARPAFSNHFESSCIINIDLGTGIDSKLFDQLTSLSPCKRIFEDLAAGTCVSPSSSL